MISAPVKVGVVGCGRIAPRYMQVLSGFDTVEVAACADLAPERAKALAGEYGIGRVLSVEEMIADPSIEVILNLTVPAAHAEVALAALEAGKSVYNEKPLAITREDGRRLLRAASEGNLRLGCAPDTFLGGGLQTCRKLIDEGVIGEPVAATAFMMSHGPESWHPDPGFYFQPGGGPMFDMGPYYITALVHLLGPARRVTGSAKISFPQRTVTSQPHAGAVIDVRTPTHVTGVIDFQNNAVATVITSFDVWETQLPFIEIYGTEGSLSVPDPNMFAGPVRLRLPEDGAWRDVELSHTNTGPGRGTGLVDLACALRRRRPHRASGELAYHVLDIIHAFLDASREGRHVELESTCVRPAALPAGLLAGALEE